MKTIRTYRKGIAMSLTFLFFISLFLPQQLWATTGPASPEFSDFESVGTSNMVNPFTGDFTYNLPVIEIPGPNGSGYAMSLSYHSGANITQDPSWVGYGWTLSPGAITRNKKGFPDDYKKANVTYYNKTKPNYTFSFQGKNNIELFGGDIPEGIKDGKYEETFKKMANSLNLSPVIYRYNSYKGPSIILPQVKLDMDIGIKGQNIGKLSHEDGVSNIKIGNQYVSGNVNSQSGFSMNINGRKILNESRDALQAYTGIGLIDQAIGYSSRLANDYTNLSLSNSLSGHLNFKTPYVSKQIGFSGQLNPSIQGNFNLLNIGLEGGINGSFSYQKNEDEETKNAYGYLHTGATTSDEDVQDYYLEHQSEYNVRTEYLHLPFSNADNFIVSGEGMGGTFRAFSNKSGFFRPNQVKNKNANIELSPEIGLGSHISLGGNPGGGYQELAQSAWNMESIVSYAFDPTFNPFDEDYKKKEWEHDGGKEGNENFVFRFANDRGGQITYSENDHAECANIGNSEKSGFTLDPKKPIVLPGSINQTMLKADDHPRSGRASHIAYNTHEERFLKEGDNYYNMFSKHGEVIKYLDPASTQLKNSISEYSIKDPAGRQFVYGLPVYSKNEADLSYGLYKFDKSDVTVHHNKIAYIDQDVTPEEAAWVTGEVRSTPYAAQYLLTQITTPNYIDLTNNGPTDDDLGGWVRFDYDKDYGDNSTSGDWYRWRIPYTGLKYERGDISDMEDDRGYVSRGEKEVYYLKVIETKTHKAEFICSVREDAQSAYAPNKSFRASPSGTRKQLKRLDAIKLYAKNSDGSSPELIKTIHFHYDYSLCPGIPNGTSGVLTLKKVWTEYENILQKDIYPYEFEYEYPNNPDYPVKYGHLKVASNSALDQNPSYSVALLDRWGNYQNNSAARWDNLRGWLDQKERGTDPTIAPGTFPDKAATFDAAAWQLKQIKLPTGGQIHVHYEQDQYTYVQDQRAMAMVRLKEIDDSGSEPRYYLDIDADLGTGNDLNTLKELLQTQFINNPDPELREKIYFKFLYALYNSTAGLDECRNDFVDGYATVASVEVDEDNTDGTEGLYLTLHKNNNLPYNFLPRQVCKEYVDKLKLGEVLLSNDCEEPTYDEEMETLEVGEADATFLSTLIYIEVERYKRIYQGLKDYMNNRTKICKELDEDHSYFRIPMTRPKKGGGLRVKRLLTFDPGLETGDQVLYGKEYIYQHKDGSCSGVATTEPSLGREENALVRNLLLRKDATYMQKVLVGTDKKQFEGPIGESLLPAPSVGYASVIVKDIHSGKTSTGYTVHEFHTYKEYPLNESYNHRLDLSPIKKTDIQHKNFYHSMYFYFASGYIDLDWITQGYRIIRYDIHGQPIMVSSYAKMDDKAPSSFTKYEYYKPKDNILVWKNFDDPVTDHYPGKEMEIIQETRKVTDNSASGHLDLDAGVSLTIPPIVTASVGPGSGANFSHKSFGMHVLNKLISYPPIIKSVTKMQDGITHTSENKAFDYYSGEAVWILNTDEFNGVKSQNSTYKDPEDKHQGYYSSFQFPTAWSYPEMGVSHQDERLLLYKEDFDMVITQTSSKLEKLAIKSKTDCKLLKRLLPGSMIKIIGKNSSGSSIAQYYYVEDYLKNPSSASGVPATTNLLVREASWMTGGTVMDQIQKLVVVRSGASNQLQSRKGSLKTYSKEIQKVGIASIPPHIESSRELLVAELNKFTTFNKSILNPVNAIVGGSCVDITTIGPMDITVTESTNSYFDYTLNMNITDTMMTFSGATPDCPFTVYKGGTFSINEDGELEYDHPKICGPILIDCIDFCPDYFPKEKIEDVLAVSATTFDDGFSIPKSIADYTSVGIENLSVRRDKYPHEFGARGKWHANATYAYNTEIKGIDGTSGQSNLIQDGTAVYDQCILFDWEHPESNDFTKWLLGDSVEMYTQDGSPIVTKNILDIYSSKKMGYHQSLPYVAGKNVDYKNLHFESFENNYEPSISTLQRFEDGYLLNDSKGIMTSEQSHAGHHSLEVVMNSTSPSYKGALNLPTLKRTDQLMNSGMVAQVWVKTQNYKAPELSISWPGSTSNVDFEYIARTGEWMLFKCTITDWPGLVGTYFQPQLHIETTEDTDVFIDDLILYPKDAEVNAYVFDVNNYRLLTVFDNNHFGAFYQYNAEGKLIRKQKETTKGLKTLSETHYHLPAGTDRPE